MSRRWTPERIEELRIRYSVNREPVREIAIAMGVTVKAVCRIRDRHLPPRSVMGDRLPDAVEIEARHAAGTSWRDIARHYGVHPNTIRRVRLRASEPPSDEAALAEIEFVRQLRRDGGHAVLTEVEIRRNRYGVALPHRPPVTVNSWGVTIKVAA
jgi:transposase-like protein